MTEEKDKRSLIVSPDPERTVQSNYWKILDDLRRTGQVEMPEAGTVQHLNIAHDDFCAIYTGGACNCDPDVSVKQKPKKKSKKKHSIGNLSADYDTLKRHVENHPLFAHAIRASNVDDHGMFQLNTPEDVISERLFCVRALLEESTELIIADGQVQTPDGGIGQGYRAWLAYQILQSIPFLWKHKVREIALGMTLPIHKLSETLMPFERLWFTWEGDLENSLPDGRVYTIYTMHLHNFCGGMQVTAFMRSHDKPGIQVHASGVGWGLSLDQQSDIGIQALVKLLAFLNTPLSDSGARKMDRALRRRLSRESGYDLDDEVHFVNLREPIWEDDYKGREPGEPVERDFRWIVRGHYRAQWYPSEQAHQLIWIEPYLKGPDGAPIRPRAYKVVR
jgi:hypothetical protein